MEKQLLGELLKGMTEMSKSFSTLITDVQYKLKPMEHHVHHNHDAESLQFDIHNGDWEILSETECDSSNIITFKPTTTDKPTTIVKSKVNAHNKMGSQKSYNYESIPVRNDFKRSNDCDMPKDYQMPVYKKYTHPIYVISTYEEPFDYLLYEHVGQPVVYNRKQRPAKAFDCVKTEWTDYLPQFLKIAEWNCWSTFEMATQLIMSFEGKSLKLLGQFDEDTKDNFHKLAYALNKYFDPTEQVESWKLKFKSRKRVKN